MSAGFSRSFGHALIGNGIAAALGALATIAAIRAVTPHEWAFAAIAVGLGPSIAAVLSLGSVTYQTRRLSRIQDTGLRKIAYSIFLCRRAVTAGLLILSSLIASVVGLGLLAMILLLAGVRFLRTGSSVYLASTRKFGLISFLNVGEKALTLLLVVIAQLVGFSHWSTLPVAFTASALLYTAVSLIFERLIVSVRLLLIALRSPQRVWSRSAKFGITSLVGPIQQADVSLLALVSDTMQAGYLGVGSRLTSALSLLGGSLASVILPYFSRKEEGANYEFRKSAFLVITTAGFILLLVTAALLTEHWVPLILGEEYVGAASIVSLYLLIVCLQTFIQPMIALLQAWDAEAAAMWIAVLQMFAMLVSTALAGFFWGAIGAAWGQLIISCCITVMTFLVIRRVISASGS